MKKYFILGAMCLFFNQIYSQSKFYKIGENITLKLMKEISPNTGINPKTEINMEVDDYFMMKSSWTARKNSLSNLENFWCACHVFIDKSGNVKKVEIFNKSQSVVNAWSSNDMSGLITAIGVVGTGVALLNSNSSSNNSYSSSSSSNSSSYKSNPAPGIKESRGVEILAWGSTNNFWTAGNNSVRYRIRNKNSYAVNVKVALLNNDGKWEQDYQLHYIPAGTIREFSTLGRAWQTSKDIRLDYIE